MLWLLIILLPLGTRLIFRQGILAGDAVEPGTVSLFATQLLAAGCIVLAAVKLGWGGLRRTLALTPAVFALFFLAAALIAASTGLEPLLSLLATAPLVFAVGLFLMIAGGGIRDHVGRLAFVAGGLIQSAFAAWQFLTQAAPASKWFGLASHDAATLGASVVETASGRWLRAYGSFSHPNILGLYIGLGLIAAVTLAAEPAQSARRRHLFQMAVAALATGLFLSFSRGAELAVLAGIGWLIFATASRAGSGRATLPLLRVSGLAVAIFLALTVALPDVMLTRVAATGRLETRSVTDRAAAAADAQRIFFDHPFLGTGPGQMPSAVHAADPARRGWEYQFAHNIPLLIATETGLLGLFAGILLIISLIGPFTAGGELRHFSGERYFTSAAFVAMLVSGLFDHFLWTAWAGLLIFWTVAGLHVAAITRAESSHTMTGRLYRHILDRYRTWKLRLFPPPIARD